MAKSLQFPTPDGLKGDAWPWRLTAIPLALSALELLLAVLLLRTLIRVRR